MKLHKKLISLTGLALMLSCTNLYAAGESARDIITNAYKYIGSMDSYAFRANVTERVLEKSNKRIVSIKVDRPGKFRVEDKDSLIVVNSYLNNGVFTMFDRKHKQYAQVKTGKGIDGTLDLLFEEYGIIEPLAQLIYSEMYKRVKFKSIKYFGTKIVGGVECDYIAFKNGKVEIHVWVATGDRPLIQAYSIIDLSTEDTSRVDATVKWDINPHISDSDFIFEIPKGTSKVSVK